MPLNIEQMRQKSLSNTWIWKRLPTQPPFENSRWLRKIQFTFFCKVFKPPKIRVSPTWLPNFQTLLPSTLLEHTTHAYVGTSTWHFPSLPSQLSLSVELWYSLLIAQIKWQRIFLNFSKNLVWCFMLWSLQLTMYSSSHLSISRNI